MASTSTDTVVRVSSTPSSWPQFNWCGRGIYRKRFCSASMWPTWTPTISVGYIRTQAFAIAEVHEAVMDEASAWKPWAVRPDGEGIVISKARYTGELADVYIFLMNLMLAGGVDTNELAAAVEAKQQKNLERWTNGYDAKKTKCRGCGRSFDDPDVNCYSSVSAEETGSLPVRRPCAEKERFIDEDGGIIQ